MELEEVCYLPTYDLLINLTPHLVNVYRDGPPLERSQPVPVRPSFWDSSLVSMYSKKAEEEDNKMAERWRKDADVTLIFVRPRASIRSAAPIN